MYLFVVVLLMSAILGLYTELYFLQAARARGSQTSIAQIMLNWHSAAYRLAQDYPTLGTTTPCSLTPGSI